MHRAQGTADDKRDSHPRRCSFPRGLHLRLHWQHISRLQFKARGPNFHAELIPVHSPLLRESYLVSYPPLTYMLKFSGFADLTSCLWEVSLRLKPSDTNPQTTQRFAAIRHCVFVEYGKQDLCNPHVRGTRHPGKQLHPGSHNIMSTNMTECIKVDTEAGMLSGISQKHSIRSNPCWFTEFCNSQCLSHFAAPFIVVRAETSVAESCNETIYSN